MGATALYAELTGRGFEMLFDGPRLFVSPEESLTERDCDQITLHKPELLRLLTAPPPAPVTEGETCQAAPLPGHNRYDLMPPPGVSVLDLYDPAAARAFALGNPAFDDEQRAFLLRCADEVERDRAHQAAEATGGSGDNCDVPGGAVPQAGNLTGVYDGD